MQLEYYKIPTLHWESHFASLRDDGVKTLSVPIDWGAHEKILGVRDFGATTRLKIERVLNLAHRSGLSLNLQLGFSRREGFPEWAWQSASGARVPTACVDETHEGAGITNIPKLNDIWQGYLDFLSELAPILQLYKGESGSVQRVTFSWGPIAFEQSELLQPFETQPTVLEFNNRFQVTVKTLSAPYPASTMRLMCEKRPWLAAYDLKRYRIQRLEDYLNDAKEIIPELQTDSFLPVSEKTILFLDDNCIEFDRSNIYPFFPAGNWIGDYANSYRQALHLKHHADRNQLSCLPLSKLGQCKAPAVAIVVGGKYLCRANRRQMMEWTTQGTRFFFPFGKPIYDECLEAHYWPTVERAFKDERRLHFHPENQGGYWMGTSDLMGYDEVVDSILRFAGQM